ncbi:ferric reductase NAD binding domain-containing protein [Limtongia smithiae]|uniref:ferric reductase NAD binding domain-containing protein n=1 Tax=Limtongia smithiae TaxID=1125753 RepID=UPI0034CE56E6
MKSWSISAVLLLSLLTFVKAHDYGNACYIMCSSYIVGYYTTTTCGDDDDACQCTNYIYAESYALCLYEVCYEKEILDAWNLWIEDCMEDNNVSASGTYESNLAAGLADYVSSDSVNDTIPASTAVMPEYDYFRKRYLARFEIIHNAKWSEYFGNILNAYWGFVILCGAIKQVCDRFLPRNGSQLGIVSVFRRYITLPAGFGSSHIEPIRLGKVPVWTVYLRWQIIVVFVFFSLSIIFIFVNMSVINGEPIYVYNSLMQTNNLGVRAGYLANEMLPLMFLFAGRNNILMWFSGFSFETFNIFHRWVARMMFIFTCVHGWTYTSFYLNVGSAYDAAPDAYYLGDVVQDWGDMVGIIACVMAGCMMIQAAYVFRHHWYEVFLSLHMSLAAVFYAMVWYHIQANSYEEYMYCALAVWCFDRFIRICRIILAGPFTKATVTVHGDAVYISAKPSIHWRPTPGQYAFLYVLRHNAWESHPFSIMESRDGHYIFVAKAHAGMTKKMHKSVTKKSGTDEVRVWIEGPYGFSHALYRYDTVLLVAGGVGITSIISYALDLKRRGGQRHVILYWMVRNEISLNWTRQQLADVMEGGQIEVHLYVTGEADPSQDKEIPDSQSTSELEEKEVAALERLPILYNVRPDITQVIHDIVAAANSSVAVMACGPGSLADVCRSATTANVGNGHGRVDYFEDAFTWA